MSSQTTNHPPRNVHSRRSHVRCRVLHRQSFAVGQFLIVRCRLSDVVRASDKDAVLNRDSRPEASVPAGEALGGCVSQSARKVRYTVLGLSIRVSKLVIVSASPITSLWYHPVYAILQCTIVQMHSIVCVCVRVLCVCVCVCFTHEQKVTLILPPFTHILFCLFL